MRYIVILIFAFSISLPLFAVEKEVTPWEPYRMISAIVDDIQKIRRAMQINTPIKAIPRNNRKTPTDVYYRSAVLLEYIEQLAIQLKVTIDTDFIIDKNTTKRKIPADVLALLKHIKQSTEEIKQHLGINDAGRALLLSPGKTPPDVYQQVERAIAMVKTLL